MKNSRFTESQVVAILQEGEAGVPVAQLARKHGMRTRFVDLGGNQAGACSRSGFYPNLMSRVVPLSDMHRFSPAGNSIVTCRYGNA